MDFDLMVGKSKIQNIVTMLFLMLGIVVFTSCGSKMDKTAEEFKNKIISHVGDLYDEKYQEKEFSFLIYKDKDTNEYLAKALVPYEGEPNSVESKYFYNVNKEWTIKISKELTVK